MIKYNEKWNDSEKDTKEIYDDDDDNHEVGMIIRTYAASAAKLVLAMKMGKSSVSSALTRCRLSYIQGV